MPAPGAIAPPTGLRTKLGGEHSAFPPFPARCMPGKGLAWSPFLETYDSRRDSEARAHTMEAQRKARESAQQAAQAQALVAVERDNTSRQVARVLDAAIVSVLLAAPTRVVPTRAHCSA